MKEEKKRNFSRFLPILSSHPMIYFVVTLLLVQGTELVSPFPVNALNGTLKECVAEVVKHYVDCRNKKFERIPTDLLNSTEKFIYLGGNQYICDCSMVWFLEVKKRQDFGIRILDDKAVTCAKPEKLRGRKISNITRTDICPRTVKSCETVLKPCQSKSQFCVNRNNAFQCKCNNGFYKEEDGNDGCIDLNECQQSRHCSSHAQCINLIGSYMCFCREGFTGNGKHCEDVDECALKSDNCHNDSVCVNRVGGYKCRCKPGFDQNKKGNLCVKTEKSTKSVIDLITSGPIGLSLLILPAFLVMICCLCRIFSRKRKPTTEKSSPSKLLASEDNPTEQEPLLSEDQEPLPSEDQDSFLLENQEQLHQQQMYMYNYDLPAEGQGILPNQSTMTTWSEDDEIDYEDYCNFDDD